jgi:enamine deaminase RidA (YjgF/YER057c/UK114 family)
MRQYISGGSPYEPIIGFSRAVRTRRIFEIAAEALARAGSSLDHVVRTRMYLTRVEDWETVGRIHGEYFSQVRPAATMVVVAQLLNPAWRIEIEMDAVIPDSPTGATGSKTDQ